MNEINLAQTNEGLKKSCPEQDQYYFGHGKLLLTGEYFVLDGAEALALPTKLGQSLSVNYTQSYSPSLIWKSYDVNGNCWFDRKFEFWHFNSVENDGNDEVAIFIQKLLVQVRKQNPHFLRDDVEVKVETRLGFPINWGLGSSSSLIYNIAQWGYVSPFELLFKTHGGSGYDIACAQSDGPILYRKVGNIPNWSPTHFYPSYKDNLYFVYLGNKKNSRDAVKEYNKKRPVSQSVISEISSITQSILVEEDFIEFRKLIDRHEEIVARELDMTPVKEAQFKDFNGSIKSLGAWGGDFILVATSNDFKTVKEYFNNFDLKDVLRFDDLISEPIKTEFSESVKLASNNLVH